MLNLLDNIFINTDKETPTLRPILDARGLLRLEKNTTFRSTPSPRGQLCVTVRTVQ